nr:disease resistance RPP8-like protein 3 [Setaria viridis]
MVEPAISAVAGSIKDLAVQETTLLCGVIGEAGFLKDELQRLQGFLKDADTKRRSGNANATVCIRQIRDATYEAENVLQVVDYMEKRNMLKKGFVGAISRYARLPSDLITLHKVGNEIQRIRRRVREIFESARDLEFLYRDNTELGNFHVDDESLQDHGLLLDGEKSWELFSTKALPPYRRPLIQNIDEFEEIGRKFARKCKGLPLALAVLGGYLSRNLNLEKWSDILQGWVSTENGQMMGAILARSYSDLPNHYIKSCFLYLAVFPEDYSISVSDLIKLWIAEGFIPPITSHTREQTARMYVSDLAQRCLVQVVSRSKAHEWIEEIRIHDILRDWCVEEARYAGLVDVIDNTIVSLPKLRFLRVLHVEKSILIDFGRVTQLTSLVLFAESMPAEMIHVLGNMNFLVEVTLGVFTLLDKLPDSQLLPQGLRVLRLLADTIKEDPMPILEKLPCLVVLELWWYEGRTMFCSAKGFPRLQELYLYHFSIEEWRLEVEAMPRLSLLELYQCGKMEKLPEGLLHLPALKELRLVGTDLNPEDDITLKKLVGKGCKVSRD